MKTKGLSKDEELLQNLRQIVLENLQNEQFGVEPLAKLHGISRSHLHRKLKLIVGKSVSQFIREIRLEEAMKLLRKDVANVSEIAYEVGFNTPSYFNSCFHEYYGFPPGEVKKRMKEENEEEWIMTKSNNETIDIQPMMATEGPSRVDNTGRYLLFREKSNGVLLSIMGGLLLIVILVITFRYRSGRNETIDTNKGNIPPRSLAILPLDLLSNDQDQEYLAAGIQEALIGELGRIKDLRVISKTSTLRYPNSNMLLQEIARQLGVDVVVEGSVFVAGDSLRLQLQLIEPFPEERHIWAQEYYQDISNVLTMQSNVIEDIANTIQIRLSDEDKNHLSSMRMRNVESYKSYLRGIYYINKSTPEDFKKGMEYLHQAIENDPADPLAYAGLAEGYLTLGHGPDPANSYWQKGEASALKAIDLDPTLASGYAALGAIKLYYERDWEGAVKNLIKANHINPNLAWNHFHYAWYLVLIGQTDQALVEHSLAKKLDPLTPIITADMGSLYFYIGMNDAAIKELNQALELDKYFGHAWWMLGNVYLENGWVKKAIEAHQKAVEINPVWKWALANTYIISGNKEKALPIISELKDGIISTRNAFGLCQIYTSLGQLDEAFYWLEHQPLDIWIPWIRIMPGFDPLRNDPRFNKFLQDINLPPI